MNETVLFKDLSKGKLYYLYRDGLHSEYGPRALIWAYDRGHLTLEETLSQLNVSPDIGLFFRTTLERVSPGASQAIFLVEGKLLRVRPEDAIIIKIEE